MKMDVTFWNIKEEINIYLMVSTDDAKAKHVSQVQED